MAEKKASFVLPTDCIEDLEDFSVAEAGELFKAILLYANEQNETDFSDRAMKMYFKRIKKYIDSANENYEKVVQANRLNGAKGGRPKKETEENPKNRAVIEKNEGFFEKPKKADTESDTDTDTESDTESVFKESTRESTPPPKKKYGESGNVMLTDDEYKRLAERMGVSKCDEYIEKLSDYMASTGKTYRSHYATIRNWWRNDGGMESKFAKDKASYDIDEFARRGEQLPVYQGGKK